LKRPRLLMVALALINLIALMVGVDVVLVGISAGFERQALYIALTLLVALAFALFGWPVLRAWRATWRFYRLPQAPREAPAPRGNRSASGKVLRYNTPARRK